MSYPTVLPRPNVLGPGWINRRFVREPRPFLQRMIDEQLEPLADELFFTRKLLFENEQLGHFLERMQAAEEKAMSAEAALAAAEEAKEAAEEAEVAAEERRAAAEEKVLRKKTKVACWKEEFDLAAEKAEKLEKEMEDKDQALSEIRAENAQLQEEVARMKAAKEDAVAGQNRLVTRHASLWTENERLRGKLAVVSRAFRKMLVAAKRDGPGHMGKRGGKASRKPSSAPKAIRGVEKRRSKAARKTRSS